MQPKFGECGWRSDQPKMTVFPMFWNNKLCTKPSIFQSIAWGFTWGFREIKVNLIYLTSITYQILVSPISGTNWEKWPIFDRSLHIHPNFTRSTYHLSMIAQFWEFPELVVTLHQHSGGLCRQAWIHLSTLSSFAGPRQSTSRKLSAYHVP